MADTDAAERRRTWALSVALCLVTLLAYAPCWNGGPVWDDDAHITRHDLRSTAGLVRIWTQLGATQQYYPLLHTAFWVQSHLWGDATGGYHIVNILLHAAAALLLLRILRRLAAPGAWLAAALFALHPVQVESVAWITELKNTLSGLFFLASFLVYLRFDERRRWTDYALCALLFVLGLASKSVVAVMPAVAVATLWWKNGKVRPAHDLLPLVPLLLAGAVSGLFTAWVERAYIGAEGGEFAFTAAQRCLIAGRAFWFYLGKAVWPADLVFIYPRWHIDARAWAPYVFPAAAILLAVVAWALRRRSRAPLAALLYYSLTIFPVLGFLNVYPFRYSFVADHFQYLAIIGPIALFSGLATTAWRRLQHAPPIAGSALVCALLGALFVLTWRQCGMYKDRETLFEVTAERNPNGWLAHYHLGIINMKSGRDDAAVTHFRRAVEIDSANIGSLNNLGIVLMRTGQTQEAIAQLRRALAIDSNYVEALNNLGALYIRDGQVDQAIVCLKRSLDLNPANPEACFNIGAALLRTGRAGESIPWFERGLSMRPDDFLAVKALRDAYAQAGRTAEAVLLTERALAAARAAGQLGMAEALAKDLASFRAASPTGSAD